MKIEEFNINIIHLTNSVILKFKSLRSNTDLLIFGYMFGYYANEIKDNLTNDLIERV